MHVELFSLCDAATDQGGKLNVLGTFDTIYAPSFPVKHPSCAVAGRLRFESTEEGTHEFKLMFIDHDGAAIVQPISGKFPVKINPGFNSATVNLVMNFQGLLLNKSGEYRIDLTLAGRVVATLPVFARLQGNVR